MIDRLLKVLLIWLCVSITPIAQAPAPTIFVVRHAERADAVKTNPAMTGSDPELSAAGHERAKSLAVVLKDAGIKEIYATELKRTHQTAAPTAASSGVTVKTVPANDVAGLVAKLKAATGNVLVVGHSNTVPEIIKSLGVSTPVTIGDTEFDNLFVLIPGASPRLVHLHYR
jgi:phosphohistidine phosphatase SixA